MVRYKPHILSICIYSQKPATVIETFLNILVKFHIQYKILSESSQTVIVVTASVKDDEKGDEAFCKPIAQPAT
jgi:hypothetical protein